MSATGRRLEVLATLQALPGVSAPQLAGRFHVSERTARRDVEHLRDLGYRIAGLVGIEGAAPGPHD